MKEYLQSSRIIDWDHPEVLKVARKLSKGASDSTSLARNCFHWVRDTIQHSSDCQKSQVTCVASDVLKEGVGYCYAKSHLLAALLRANHIPAALVYQRLAIDDMGARFCLHGLVAVHLDVFGWYRIDPRGNRPGVNAQFTPPVEQLAFELKLPGEMDVPGRFVDPLPEVVQVLSQCTTAAAVLKQLPDLAGEVTIGSFPEEEISNPMQELPIDGALDLHTFLPQDLKHLIPAYLEECRAKGILEVRVIHGKGIGNVMRSTHSILQKLECVERFGEAGAAYGGAGATIVHLKRLPAKP